MKSKRAGDWSQVSVDGSELVPPGEVTSYRKLLWMVQSRCRNKAIMKWCGQPRVQCLRLLSGLALSSNTDIALEIWLHSLPLKQHLVLLYRRWVPCSWSV